MKPKPGSFEFAVGVVHNHPKVLQQAKEDPEAAREANAIRLALRMMKSCEHRRDHDEEK